MKYNILNKKRIFNQFFHVDHVEIEIDRFQSEQTYNIKRYHIERPEVVAVILEKESSGEIVMIEQFRYSTLKSSTTNGWTTEIVGGLIDQGETPLNAAKRECFEETGYQVKELTHLTSYFSNGAITNELIHLYYCKVNNEDKKGQGGGIEEEKEDLNVVEIPYQKLIDSIQKGEIKDAKTIIAIQWLLLQKTKIT